MSEKIPSSEITPEKVYFNRRNFIKAVVFAGTALATGTVYRLFNPPPPPEVVTALIGHLVF